jgi:hypothetical protein
LSLRELCGGDCSPGRILLLNEDEIRLRLESTDAVGTGRNFDYLPSAIDGRVVRPSKTRKEPDLLRLVYGRV